MLQRDVLLEGAEYKVKKSAACNSAMRLWRPGLGPFVTEFTFFNTGDTSPDFMCSVSLEGSIDSCLETQYCFPPLSSFHKLDNIVKTSIGGCFFVVTAVRLQQNATRILQTGE